jgi:hypothetical protein
MSASKNYVQSCPIPMMVLPGVDSVHPRQIALEIVDLAPNAELIDSWNSTLELRAAAATRVRDLLNRNTPG